MADRALLSASSAAAPVTPAGRFSFHKTICTISGVIVDQLHSWRRYKPTHCPSLPLTILGVTHSVERALDKALKHVIGRSLRQARESKIRASK